MKQVKKTQHIKSSELHLARITSGTSNTVLHIPNDFSNYCSVSGSLHDSLPLLDSSCCVHSFRPYQTAYAEVLCAISSPKLTAVGHDHIHVCQNWPETESAHVELKP